MTRASVAVADEAAAAPAAGEEEEEVVVVVAEAFEEAAGPSVVIDAEEEAFVAPDVKIFDARNLRVSQVVADEHQADGNLSGVSAFARPVDHLRSKQTEKALKEIEEARATGHMPGCKGAVVRVSG